MGGWGVMRRDIEATTVVHAARDICAHQAAGNRHSLHAHPVVAGSRTDEHMAALMRNPKVGTVVGHQCQHGQTALPDPPSPGAQGHSADEPHAWDACGIGA